MPKISTPVEGFTGVVVGVRFTDGVGETEDPIALAYFARQGYHVEVSESSTGEGKPTKKWTVPQLKAYADEQQIDISEGKTKDDILALIEATTSSEDVPEEESGEELPEDEEENSDEGAENAE